MDPMTLPAVSAVRGQWSTETGRRLLVLRWQEEGRGGTVIQTLTEGTVAALSAWGEQAFKPQNSFNVLGEVQTERRRQDVRWGEQNHEALYWLGIAMEELGETAKAVIEFHTPTEIRKEAIQLAAVVVAMVESLDRAADRQGRAAAETTPGAIPSPRDRAIETVDDWIGTTASQIHTPSGVKWGAIIDNDRRADLIDRLAGVITDDRAELKAAQAAT